MAGRWTERIVLGFGAVFALAACGGDDGGAAGDGGAGGQADSDAGPVGGSAAGGDDGGANDPDAAVTDPDAAVAPDAGGPGCGASIGPDPVDPMRVGTTEGYAVGQEAAGVRAWLGLPFAAPPVGDLRFASPGAPECRAADLAATAFAPKCVQISRECATGASADCTVEGEEDCLYLNVWRPARASGDARPRPVLFFIHGGGNAIGSTSEEAAPGTVTYDGAALADLTDSVVVTTAYRLGPFGWAAHPDLALPENGGRSGNYGLADLVASLRWVQRNAAAFEADPARVMIFGESAGGLNVCMLLASPAAAGLFQSALMQSGGCPAYTAAQVEGTTREMLEGVGCAGAALGEAACLRAKSAADLLLARPPEVIVAGRGTTFYQPHVDGDLLPEAPLTAFAAGTGNKVPTVVGANADETAASLPPIASDAAYDAALDALFGPLAPAVRAQYPADRFETPWDAMMRVTTDAKFVCPVRATLRALATPADAPPLWRYFYTHKLDNTPRREPYAQHGIELFFVFQHLNVAGYRPSADEEALANFIGRSWGNLARNGDPALPEPPAAWPAFTPAGDEHIVLEGGDVHAAAGVRTLDCDFWDGLL